MHGADADYYARVARWNATDRYRGEVAHVLQALAMPPGARLLDVGCGTGTLLGKLRAVGLAAIGLDRGAAWAASCTERPVVRGDAGTLPFATAALDAVVLMHVHAHLASPIRALGEIARVLRPNGRLVIVTPNLRYLQALRPFNRWLRYRPDPTVERHATARSLRRQVTAAGFCDVRVTRFGDRPRLLPIELLAERLLLVATREDRRP